MILAADHATLRSQYSCDLSFGRHIDTLRAALPVLQSSQRSVDAPEMASAFVGTSARLVDMEHMPRVFHVGVHLLDQ